MPEEGESTPTYNAFHRWLLKYFSIVDKPVTVFREKVVEPLHDKNKTYYYHRRFRRVPTIDECYTDDAVCAYEADQQFRRDRLVDNEILAILRERRMECEHYYGLTDAPRYCKKQAEDYKEAETNWFTKYGDIGASGTVKDAYMKQKHRMIWERRHGPVGSGMKDQKLSELD